MTNHSCIFLCNSQGWLTENLLEFAAHHGNLGLGTFCCQVTFVADITAPRGNELPERGRTEREVTGVRSPHSSDPAQLRGASLGGAGCDFCTLQESTPLSQLLHWCGRQTAACPSCFIVTHQQSLEKLE